MARSTPASPRVCSLLVLACLSGCGDCAAGNPSDGGIDGPWRERRDAPWSRWDSGPPDGGYDGGVDAGPPSYLPEVERFTTAPCGDWSESTFDAPPDGDWRVLWSWEVPTTFDPIYADKTDFGFPQMWRMPGALTSHRVYLPLADTGGVTALSASGELLWGHNFPEPFGDPADDADDAMLAGPPVATPDGDVLVASTHDDLICYDPDGTEKWARHHDDWADVTRILARQDPIALGPGGRVYWAPITRHEIHAINRCGETEWIARFPGGSSFDRRHVFVDEEGYLVVVVTEFGVYRLTPSGVPRLIFESHGLSVGQLLHGGAIHLKSGVAPTDTSAFHEATIDPDGEILESLDYPWLRVHARLDPLGVVGRETGPLPDGELLRHGHWVHPDASVRFAYPSGLAFDNIPGGSVRLEGGSIVIVPISAPDPDRSDDFWGLLELAPPDNVRSRIEAPGLDGFVSCLPSGRMAIVNGAHVVLVQTDARPDPYWSHLRANAWNTNSLAVGP